LLDRKALSMERLKHLILDETDQMLNIGFQDDIEKILKKIKDEFDEHKKSIEKIQFLLFSATIPKWVEKIASKFMKDNVVRIDNIKESGVKSSKTVEHLALFVPSKEHKTPAIGDILLVYGGAHSRTIIFTDKKEEANEVMLNGQLKVESQVLHGDIPQKQREITFKSFREGKLKCLIATNVAARGLDIPEVDLIIQLSPPNDVETYIHRSGRTGRAGKSGVCVTFYTKRQQEFMDKIEYKASIKFKKIGSPQPQDIMRATARDVAFSLDNVSNDVLGHFNSVPSKDSSPI
jgi:ATP-dependent RNA helicase DDX21